ncbi:MAG: hypothetical protein MRJ92_10435 [Nitrospira sp.]|nr:hypothetical protein [Nitrospira sp.]
MKYGDVCVTLWSAAAIGIAGALLFLPLQASAGASEAALTVIAQGPVQPARRFPPWRRQFQAIPTANSIDRKHGDSASQPESTSLESLLLEKG